MTTEQQKKMLEAIGKRNESIELLGKSFGEGMKKLDEQADDLLEKMGAIKEDAKKLVKGLDDENENNNCRRNM